MTSPNEVWDASQRGIGAVVMRMGQVLVYSSRSLTSARERYAQIGKEMLKILHRCTKFHDYIFAQPRVLVECDCRPPQAICKTLLHQCPLRLQRMRVAIQRYSLEVMYKPGKEFV